MNRKPEDFDPRFPALKTFDSIMHLAYQAGKLHDPRVVRTLQALRMSPTNPKAVEALVQKTSRWLTSRPEYIANMEDRNPFQPYPGKIVNGPIVLGQAYNPRLRYPIKFGLFPNEINMNIACFGRVGTGKTNINMLLMAGLIKRNYNFWAFDYKLDYRNLVKYF